MHFGLIGHLFSLLDRSLIFEYFQREVSKVIDDRKWRIYNEAFIHEIIEIEILHIFIFVGLYEICVVTMRVFFILEVFHIKIWQDCNYDV